MQELHYRDYHLLLEEQAQSILESSDPLAERVRRIGATTIRSITHIDQLQTITDDNNEFATQPDNSGVGAQLSQLQENLGDRHRFPCSLKKNSCRSVDPGTRRSTYLGKALAGGL